MNFRGTSKYCKFSEMMQKKTHFTGPEIDKLTDLHKNTMVCLIQENILDFNT